MRAFFTCLLALALSFAVPGASAQLFKWVDEDGVVNYGDWPPSGTKLRAINHGTVSVVAGVPKQQMDEMRGRDEQRKPQRVRRDSAEAATAPAVPASVPTDDSQTIDGYAASDYGYPPRRIRPLEPNNRPRPEQPIANPTLPINPAVPDMPLRPRR